MKGKFGWLIALGLWMISLVVVVGSIALSLIQGGLPRPSSEGEKTLTSTEIELPAETQPVLESSPTPTIPASPTATATETEMPTPTCVYPADWVMVTIQAETSLSSLAAQYGISVEAILQANCLSPSTEVLGANTTLYIPPATPTPSATATEKPRKPKATQGSDQAKCGPPAHWVIYIVQKGDTLFNISLQTGASIAELQWANCLGNSTTVRVGQKLYVPKLPQVKQPTPTSKPPKPTKPPATSAPGVTPIPITPKPTNTP